MCGRYTLIEPNLESILKLDEVDQRLIDDRPKPITWSASYNVAPFRELPVFALKNDGKIHLTYQHCEFPPLEGLQGR